MDISDRLEVKIIEGFDLPLIDGLKPNIFCEVEVGNDVKRTKVVPESRDPTWDASPFVFSQIIVQGVDSIIIRVNSKDNSKGVDLPIGCIIIPIDTPFNSPGIEINGKFDVMRTTSTIKAINHQTSLGKMQVVLTYFNQVDPAVLLPVGGMPQGAPNLLLIHVSDAINIGFGRTSVDAFVSIEVGDLRKETHVVRKSVNPSWDEDITIPTQDGSEIIEVTVRHASLVRNIFLGKVRIALNEVAEAGDMGLTKSFQLLNENLQFEDSATSGVLQLTLKWYFDKSQDEENAKYKAPSIGIFSRLKSLIMKKPKPAVEKEEDAEKESTPLLGGDEAEEEEPLDAGAALQMTPFEWAQYLHERSMKRQEEIAEVGKRDNPPFIHLFAVFLSTHYALTHPPFVYL